MIFLAVMLAPDEEWEGPSITAALSRKIRRNDPNHSSQAALPAATAGAIAETRAVSLRQAIGRKPVMYAGTGITGKVGGVVARLLTAGLPVRAVVRDAKKGGPWAKKGCEVVVASITDRGGLTRAFSGADGVFLMTPPGRVRSSSQGLQSSGSDAGEHEVMSYGPRHRPR